MPDSILQPTSATVTSQQQPPAAAVPPPTIYINFFDGINDSKVKTLMGMVSQIVAQHKPQTLYFLFSSPGGQVNAGIVLYNFLRALPVEIVMHNTGAVDSIGTVIFLAGAKRYAASHSTFLFHGVQTIFQANAQFGHVQLVEQLSMLRQDENKIAGIISERSQLTLAEIKELFHQGESKDISFAKDKGIIHDVREPAIPKDAPFITINLN